MTARRLLLVLAFLSSILLPLSLTSAAGAAGCFNNDCPASVAGLKYNGGPLTTTPQVYLIRFSSSTTSLAPASGFLPQDFAKNAPNLASLTNLIVDDQHTGWWMQEYSTPQYSIGLGKYVSTDTVYAPALATGSHTTFNQIEVALNSGITSGEIPSYSANAIYMVILRANQYGPTSSCGATSQVSYAPPGGTTDAQVPFGVIESFTHADPRYCPPASLTPFNAQTLMFSYYLATLVTNPGPTPGWAAPDGQNIVGACASPAAAVSNLSYKGHIYDTFKYYSAEIHACLSTPLPTKLTAHLDGSRVVASLSSKGTALPNRIIYIHAGTSVVASGTTNAAGNATIPIPGPVSPSLRLVAALGKVPALTPVAVTVTNHQVTGHIALSFTDDAPTIVPAGHPFSFSVHVSPASNARIHISGPDTSYTTTLNADGTGILKATAPLGTDHYTVTSSSDPSLHHAITITGARTPTLTLTAIGAQSVSIKLTNGAPIAGAVLKVSSDGVLAAHTVTTNAAGTTSDSVIFPDSSGSTRVTVTYPGTGTTFGVTKSIILTK